MSIASICQLGQRIAIKVLHTAVTQRDELLAELQREFQHLQLLSHPNIVRVHEFDRDGDDAFFTMEALIGALLSQVIGARNAVALPRPYALAIMRDVGAALAHAHSRGVVHGDINPQNIFITNDGELRVLDFGARTNCPAMPVCRNVLPSPLRAMPAASCSKSASRRAGRPVCICMRCLPAVVRKAPFPRLTALEARAQRVRPPRPPGYRPTMASPSRRLRWERDRRPQDVRKWLNRFGLAAAALICPR